MSSNRHFIKAVTGRIGAVALLALSSAEQAFAQDATAAESGTDSGAIGEIIVTAQKRGENIQKVPIAITALSGDVLAQQGVRNSLDLTKSVPGLQINQLFQASNPTIFLRGVGVNDYNAASSGAIGITVDDVFLNSGVGALFAVFDVDRVEVLKGPQGTLYGRNTTGGVINYTTKRPSFTPDFSASLTGGRFNQIFFDAAGGGALVPEKLAARVSVTVKKRDGWAVNVQDGRDINGIDTYAGRLQLLFTPSDSVEIQNKIEGGKSQSSALGHQSLGTFNPEANRPCTGPEILARTICVNPISGYRANENIDEFNTDVLNNAESLVNFADRLQVNWKNDSISVTAVSGYVWNKRRLNQDQDYSPFAVASSPIWLEKSEQFSQELRVSSVGNGPLNWVAGVYYLQETLDSLTDFSVLRMFNPDPTKPYFNPAIPVVYLERDFSQRTISKAIFAQFDYQLTDTLTATAGIRYTDDKKKLRFQTYGGPVNPDNDSQARLTQRLVGFVDSDPASPAVDGPARRTTTLKKPTWRLALAYQAAPTVNAYAAYSRGVRAGGYNTGALFNDLEFNEAKSETIDAFEVGVKSDLFDRHLRFNAAAFYYDYRNMQVFGIEANPGGGVPLQRLQNADAEIYGAEVDIHARPVRGFDVNFGAAYVHAQYAKFVDALRGDLKGNTLDKSPRWQLTGSVNYSTPVSEDLTARVGANVSYQSRTFFSPSNVSPLVSEGRGEINLNAGLAHRSGVDVSVFVRNVGNKRYLTDMNDLSSLGF